jgi:hypothetical protein
LSEQIDWYALSETLDFESVIAELGLQPVAVRKGYQYDFHCPLPDHPGADRRPSFGINSEELIWHCFTCDEGGTLPRLVEILTEADGWNSALEWLLPFSDYEHNPVSDPDLVKFRERTRKALERAGSPPKSDLSSVLPIYPPSALKALEDVTAAQLSKWGIKSEKIIDRFGIKYDPERERHGYIGPAIVVPHLFRGELVGYQERWLDDNRPQHIPKWTNSDSFPRKETIFNYDDKGDVGIVVEAAMTAIRVKEVVGGEMVPVATFGASISDIQLFLLTRFKCLFVAYDSDPPYRNKLGHLVVGAGVRAKAKVSEAMAPYMPVWILPATDVSKGDLADETDEGIESLILQAEPYSN